MIICEKFDEIWKNIKEILVKFMKFFKNSEKFCGKYLEIFAVYENVNKYFWKHLKNFKDH